MIWFENTSKGTSLIFVLAAFSSIDIGTFDLSSRVGKMIERQLELEFKQMHLVDNLCLYVLSALFRNFAVCNAPFFECAAVSAVSRI